MTKSSNPAFGTFVVLIVALLLFGAINIGFKYLFNWIFELDKLWFIIGAFVLSGIGRNVFLIIAEFILLICLSISGSGKVVPILTILSLINGGILGYYVWTAKPDYTGLEIFGAIILTIGVAAITSGLGDGIRYSNQI